MLTLVPNFSEGRNRATLDAFEGAVRAVPGGYLLDIHADAFHHRSVFTIAGEAEPLLAAAYRTIAIARDIIDLRTHTGQHPRVGAADVVPFAPLDEEDMDVCIGLAAELGARVGDELEIPVFLYGRAALKKGRRLPAQIRKPGLTRLGELIRTDPAWAPDFGPTALHPTAGAVMIGARKVLVAYNVFLDTDDVTVARRIAKEIRESAGGFPALQALGFLVDGKAQVSMNLLNIDLTSPTQAFDAVAEAARRAGVGVLRSEVVGLMPERALPKEAERRLKLAGAGERVLEWRLKEVVRSQDR
jgi:glutamate formiminotransferase/glutamate formiminotransferase/formiminotetrahydrofolate cyclodeaminase